MKPGYQVPAGYSVTCFNEIDSTNAEALRQADEGRNGPLWIVAKHQLQGRGRRGRTWITAPGNLFATLLLNWPGPASILSQLSFVAAVATADMLKQLLEKSGCPAEVSLKWPNDILLEKAKVGGILIETSGVNTATKSTAVAIGIGMNVASHPEETLAYPTTDFSEHGLIIKSDDVFEQLAESFDRTFKIWQSDDGFASIKQRWLDYGPTVGQELKVNTGVEVITGAFAGLDEHAGLQIHLPDGSLQIVLAGDIIATDES